MNAVEKLRFTDPVLFKRVTVTSLEEYTATLKNPNRHVTWEHREEHVCCRLVQNGFSAFEIQNIFEQHGVGVHYRQSENKQAYFDQMYNRGIAAANFEQKLVSISLDGNVVWQK